MNALDQVGELSGDDETLWQVVVGVVLAPGLLLRDAAHAWTALLASEGSDREVDPHIDDVDLRLDSPVVGLQNSRLAWPARYLSFAAGYGMWVMLSPPEMPTWALVYIGANAGFCMADPLWGIIATVRKTVATTNILESKT